MNHPHAPTPSTSSWPHRCRHPTPPSPSPRRRRRTAATALSSSTPSRHAGHPRPSVDRRRQVTGSVLPLAALTPLPNSPGCFFSGPDKFCAAVPTEDLTTATEQLTHGRQKQCRAVRRLRPPLVIKNPTAAAIVTSARRGKRQRRHCLRGIPPPTSDRYQGKV